ncbi:DNA mismatch repair protein MSH3 isoform X2 [Amborella trichopoda]|uniref:DNA mismatch repair protein MSH3 isoform X2 n=1 Tax=Amborella trichopoda TaxID=13333 RepID=UPI0009BCA86E|nr:DNA mismatch repair protein MSH3 isoform X2 [Amborella trichopoda]|eukprot:XP_020526175.1 DNA mismatch repair protein MSH3 isoform X2 [Amborella trichopoda]
MGKQKQQVISRFFAPKEALTSTPPSKKLKSCSSSPSPGNAEKTLISAKTVANSSKPIVSSKAIATPPKTLISPAKSDSKSSLPAFNPSLHRKFLEKLLNPPSSNRTLSNHKLASNDQKFTPLEQQVLSLKSQYPDVLLMVEVGYKFRFFGEDAETAARALGIYCHQDHNFMTASIPSFRLHVHVRRLVGLGFKVGVVKQTETAAIKAHGSNKVGPFSRGLSALYTKATIEAAGDLGGELGDACYNSSNYVMCVVEKSELGFVEEGFDTRIGILAVEISTGDVIFGEFKDGVMRAQLEAVLLSVGPAELLLGSPLSAQTEKILLGYAGPTSNVRVERASRECFNDGGALAEVMSLYEKLVEDGSTVKQCEQKEDIKPNEKLSLGVEGIMAMPELPVQALALVLRYLKQFELERILCLATFRPLSSSIEMTLSSNILQQLEVLRNNSDGSEIGSLIKLMDNTLTAFGSRLLKHWLTHPLRDRISILARLDAVSEIADSIRVGEGAHNAADNESTDCGAKVVRVELYNLLSSVLTTLGRSPDVQRGIARIFHRTATPKEFIAVIHALLCASKQLQRLDLGEESNEGPTSPRSDLLRRLILTASSLKVTSHAAKLLSALNKDAADLGDINNLFIASNDKFQEVARGCTAVQAAEEKLDALIGQYRKILGIRNLEFLSVSGSTHLIENYVRPVFLEENEPAQIQIQSGRHPVLESILQESFVPNDTNLHVEREYCQIVTGPNMGGKSCYIRQVALIAIMAQVGSFVPASSARLHVLDAIYTRMGASDSIQHGSSTFFEELSETSSILHSCSSRSLVIIDELGRGTSTHDGVAIAYATLHYLLKEKKCLVLFVTHYPKIIDIKYKFPGSVGPYHVSYLTTKTTENGENTGHGNVTFLYKVVPGGTDKSFGLNVAGLAQLPASCIARAAVMAAKLESDVCSRLKNRLSGNIQRVSVIDHSPFDEHGVREKEYLEVFSLLWNSLLDSDPSNCLHSLKDIQKHALEIFSSENGQ